MIFFQNAFTQSEFITLKVDNRIRNFVVYKPQNYTPNMPLVLNLHGFTLNGNAQMLYTQFNKIADEVGCVVVYPSGIQRRWSAGTFMGVQNKIDDVSFLGQLIDYMAINYSVDLTKVYSTGYSAGGFMSYRLACDLAGRIAAISPVSSSMTQEVFSDCNPSRKIPILCINGTNDPVVSYNGIPGQFPSTKKIVEFWTSSALCDPVLVEDTLPNISLTDKCKITHTSYPSCAGSAPFEFYKVIGGGHTWPGANPVGIVGNTNQDIDANHVIWDFLSQYQIPQDIICSQTSNLSVNNNGCNINMSWNNITNITNYRISVIDETEKSMKIYQSATNNFSFVPIAGHHYRWSVAANCESEFLNLAIGEPFDACGTINERISNNSDLRLYPNPTSGKIMFEGNELTAGKTIEIVDIVGKSIKSFYCNSGINELDISEIQAGIYILRTNVGNITFVKQ